MIDKVRHFMPGESLNTIFSARRFGLALAVDVTKALESFPFSCDGCVSKEPHEFATCDAYNCSEIEPMRWLRKWFSDFIEYSELASDKE